LGTPIRLQETSMPPRRHIRSLSLLVVAIIATILSGCYERVVGVKGGGPNTYDVYEPNLNERQEQDLVDGIGDFFGGLFGQKKEEDTRR